MNHIWIPTEQDIKQWIKEALDDYFAGQRSAPHTGALKNEPLYAEPFLNRKQIAALLDISLVTLHTWMHKGLPFHKQGARVYFLKSEVFAYVVAKKGSTLGPLQKFRQL